MPAHRKADEMHDLHGSTPHGRAADLSQVEPGRPKPPRCLSAAAKTIFRQLCGQLASRKTLTAGDGQILGLAAAAWDRWSQAQQALQTQGIVRMYTKMAPTGVTYETERVNTWLKVGQDAEKAMLSYLDRLGLSPVAKDRAKPSAAPSENEAPPPGSMGALHPEWFGKNGEYLGPAKPETRVVPIAPPATLDEPSRTEPEDQEESR